MGLQKATTEMSHILNMDTAHHKSIIGNYYYKTNPL